MTFPRSNIKRGLVLFRCSPNKFLCLYRYIACPSKWFEDNGRKKSIKYRKPEKNLKLIVEKCHTYVFNSGLAYKTWIGLPVPESTHEMTEHVSSNLGICYVDNRNIKRKHLWKDGLHLIRSGKIILAYNFLSCLSKHFLIRIQHLRVFT